jgi:hypothetical protein
VTANSNGWLIARSVAVESIAMTSARRTPEDGELSVESRLIAPSWRAMTATLDR